MEPTSTGGVLGDLSRLVKGPHVSVDASRAEPRVRWLYRRYVIDLLVIAAAVVTLIAYIIAVIAFARWAL